MRQPALAIRTATAARPIVMRAIQQPFPPKKAAADRNRRDKTSYNGNLRPNSLPNPHFFPGAACRDGNLHTRRSNVGNMRVVGSVGTLQTGTCSILGAKKEPDLRTGPAWLSRTRITETNRAGPDTVGARPLGWFRRLNRSQGGFPTSPERLGCLRSRSRGRGSGRRGRSRSSRGGCGGATSRRAASRWCTSLRAASLRLAGPSVATLWLARRRAASRGLAGLRRTASSRGASLGLAGLRLAGPNLLAALRAAGLRLTGSRSTGLHFAAGGRSARLHLAASGRSAGLRFTSLRTAGPSLLAALRAAGLRLTGSRSTSLYFAASLRCAASSRSTGLRLTGLRLAGPSVTTLRLARCRMARVASCRTSGRGAAIAGHRTTFTAQQGNAQHRDTKRDAQ
jgi:hypothetical protein